MTTVNFDLTIEARKQWTDWLQTALHRANTTQKEVAIEIDGNRGDGSAKRTEVNRFVKGHPDALRRWFTQRTEWLERFATIAQLKVADMRERLALIGTGRAGVGSGWHRAFPDVLLADVEIEAALEGGRGETVEQVIGGVLRSLGDPERWSERKTPERVALVASPGRAREIAARQLQALLTQQLDVARAKALSAREERQGSGTPSTRKSLEIPTFRVEVVTAPLHKDVQSPGVAVVVMDDVQARATENITPHSLRLIPWGPKQAIELAHRLAELLPTSARRALRDFAQKVEQLPAIVGPEATPDLVIQLLAEVGRRGCPNNVPDARDLLARAAWDQARVRCGETLDPFDERLMCQFMSELATRERTNADDVRSWTHIPRAVALDALRNALRSLLGPAAGRPLADLVTEAETAKGAARQAAFEAMRVALASEPCEDILRALIAGGVFTEDAAYTGPCLRIVEPPVAAIWAARGLGDLPAFDKDWQRLLDPDWLPVLDELCRRGLGHEVLQARLAACPADLALDAAAWTVRLAAHTSSPIAVVRPAWATVVWAHIHGMYLPTTAWGTSAWGAWVPRLLRQLSMDHRHELPFFEADPVQEFEGLVPETSKAMVARWRRTSGSAKRQRPEVDQWGWYLFDVEADRDTLERTLCDLCPGQVVPLHPWSFAWSDGHKLGQGLSRLIEVAASGDPRAIQLLDGSAWLEAQQAELLREPGPMDERHQTPIAPQVWHQLPADGLLLWAVRAGHAGQAAASILVDLAARIGPAVLGDSFGAVCALAEQAGMEEVTRLCSLSLLVNEECTGRPLRPETAIALAGHMGLVELLHEVVQQPAYILPQCRLHVRKGLIRASWPLGHELLQLRSGTKFRGFVSSARIDLEERLNVLEQRAHDAAIQLYRMGDSEVLVERWKVGPTYIQQLPLWKDRRRIEGLLGLITDGFPSSWFQTKDLLAFADYRRDDLSLFCQPGSATSVLQCLATSIRSRPTFFVSVLALADVLRPDILAMADGLLALVDELPEVLSPEAERIIGGEIPMIRPADTEDGPRLVEYWRCRAVNELIKLGDKAPLRDWVYGQDREQRRENQIAVSAVGDWLKLSADHLDRIWKVVQDEVATGRLAGTEREQLEWRLLYEGSARDATKRNVLAPPDGLERPRPYVVSEALRTTNEEFWMRLYYHNSHHADWTAVIRQELAQNTDSRTRAALALDLSRHHPDAKELVEALRYWALEDPSPFLGGPSFDWRARRAVGGVLPLLTALCSANVPWIDKALVRLWRIAVQLPIADRRPRYETERWDEAPPAVLMVLLDQSRQCPSPLAELASQLEARGLGAEVIRIFEHPPEVPAPERSQLVVADHTSKQDRHVHLREWLRPWWIRLAPDATLYAALTADPSRVPLDVLDQLVSRRFKGLETVCTSLASHSDMFVLRPLLETKPALAEEVVVARLSAPVAPIRMELASAISASVSVEFRHLGVLRELRRVAGQLDATAGVATPSGGGPDDAPPTTSP